VDAGPASALATRLHQIRHTAGVLAEVAEELHRLDAQGARLDGVELSDMYNISQELACLLQSLRAFAALLRQDQPPSSQAALRKSRPKHKQPTRGLKQCVQCHHTKTPVWRNGPQGPRSLCNPCGLLYAKKMQNAMTTCSRPRRLPHMPPSQP
jgi:hypothetical protein